MLGMRDVRDSAIGPTYIRSHTSIQVLLFRGRKGRSIAVRIGILGFRIRLSVGHDHIAGPRDQARASVP